MADIRSLLRSEQASRRITHPNLSYTKSGLLNCLVCNLVIKSESLWEGHLKSANHKKNLQKIQNGAPQDGNGNASKKRKVSDDGEDVRKKRKSTNQEEEEEEDIDEVLGQRLEEERKSQLPSNTKQDDMASSAIPEYISSSSAPQPLPIEALATTPPPPQPEPQPQIDEDEWAAFEREVVPLARQKPPPDPTNYSSATISVAPVSAAELAAQTSAERQQRRDADVEDEKAEEESRLVEEFEVMEGLEERVKRLKEKREALRMAVGVTGSGGAMEDDAGPVEAEGQQQPPDPDGEEDDTDEIDEWEFA